MSDLPSYLVFFHGLHSSNLDNGNLTFGASFFLDGVPRKNPRIDILDKGHVRREATNLTLVRAGLTCEIRTMDSTNDSDDTYNVIPRCVSSANSHTSHGSPNNHTFFKSIQWCAGIKKTLGCEHKTNYHHRSPDGTCIAANGHDNHIRTYVL